RDEAVAPRRAQRIAFGKKASGKPPAQPQSLLELRLNLEDIERIELEIRYPSGKRFARLAQQVYGCGAKQQKLTRRCACEGALIDDSAQHLKQAGGTLDLVDDREPVSLPAQVGFRVAEFREVSRTFEIEIVSRAASGERGK